MQDPLLMSTCGALRVESGADDVPTRGARAGGPPLDVGFGRRGRAGLVDPEVLKPFLGRREGTEDSIMGLPIQLLYRLLDEALEGQPHASAIVA